MRLKLPKLQMHENLHKNVNEKCFHSHFYANVREFIWWAIKATNMQQLTLLISLMVFNHFKMAVQF